MVCRATRNSRHRPGRSDGVRDSAGFDWLLAGAVKQHRVTAERTSPRFGEELIRFTDPDGLLLELVAVAAGVSPANVEPWPDSPVPAEHMLRGFHSVSAALEGYERTARLLTESLGYRLVDQSGNRFRFDSADDSAPGKIVDLLCQPDTSPGRVAGGSVHHIAFRAKDEAEQVQWRELLVDLGYNVTPVIDRTYFQSIYFRQPAGCSLKSRLSLPVSLWTRKWKSLACIYASCRRWNRRDHRSNKFCREFKCQRNHEASAGLHS